MQHVAFRVGSEDASIWDAIAHKNEYGIREWRGDVIDIGAHIGAFVHIAGNAGARIVYAIEPDANNFQLLKFNTNTISNVIYDNLAVGPSFGVAHKHHDTWPNTGGQAWRHDCSEFGSDAIKMKTLDTVIAALRFHAFNKEQPSDVPILLKLDCEGMEYDILRNSNLPGVKGIVGEYHVQNGYDEKWLVEYLQRLGFHVSTSSRGAVGVFAGHRD